MTRYRRNRYLFEPFNSPSNRFHPDTLTVLPFLFSLDRVPHVNYSGYKNVKRRPNGRFSRDSTGYQS